MHLDVAAASRARMLLLALLLLVGLLGSGAQREAAADASPVQPAQPPELLATASITRTDLSSQVETYSTRTAKVAGTLDRGLWVDWDDVDVSGTVIEFDSSPEHALHTGVFANVGPDTGLPNIDVYGDHYFDTRHGEFDVLDLATDSQGHFTRFDIVFITSTTYGPDAAFGEVRLNEDAPNAVVSPSAAALRWPLTARHSDPLYTVETLTNTTTSKVQLGKAKLSAGATTDYRIRRDRCSRRTLSPAASCTLLVGFSPAHGGPRAAVLTVPTGSHPVAVSLAGAALLGTTKLAVSGTYAPGKKKTVYQHVTVEPDYNTTSPRTGYKFFGNVDTPNHPHGFDMDIGGPRPFTRGTHPTHETNTPHEDYLFSVLLDYRCYDMTGTITIDEFRTDRRNIPTEADITLRQHCDQVDLRGRLQWQDRRDLHAPPKPSKLRITKGKVHWTHAKSKDYAATIVRAVPGTGADATPLNGYAVSSSRRATSARLPTLAKGQTYTLLAYSLDKTGNASKATTLTFTA